MNITLSSEKQYGILFSGGIVSSLLLYCMMKGTPNAKIQPFTIAKSEGSMLYADPIINYFNSKFGWNIPQTIEVGNPLMQSDLIHDYALSHIWMKHKYIDEVFIGVTRFPEEILIKDYPGVQPKEYVVRRTFQPQPIADIKVKMPFLLNTRDQILQIAYNEDLVDLLVLTKSCLNQTVGRCGHCWTCACRFSAFTTLEKTDPGTN